MKVAVEPGPMPSRVAKASPMRISPGASGRRPRTTAVSRLRSRRSGLPGERRSTARPAAGPGPGSRPSRRGRRRARRTASAASRQRPGWSRSSSADEGPDADVGQVVGGLVRLRGVGPGHDLDVTGREPGARFGHVRDHPVDPAETDDGQQRPQDDRREGQQAAGPVPEEPLDEKADHDVRPLRASVGLSRAIRRVGRNETNGRGQEDEERRPGDEAQAVAWGRAARRWRSRSCRRPRAWPSRSGRSRTGAGCRRRRRRGPPGPR